MPATLSVIITGDRWRSAHVAGSGNGSGPGPRPYGMRLVLRTLVALGLLSVVGTAAVTEPGGHVRRVEAPIARPSVTAAPATAAPDPRLPADVLARLPRFGPPPPPVPMAPDQSWLGRVPTTQPVAFLTIDDGWHRLPEAAALVRAARVPVTLFLTVEAIRPDPGYFREFQDAGARIEAHTLTHPTLRGKPYSAQRHQLCGSVDQLRTWYGRRPYLFRAPFGEHDATTLAAARDCGIRATVFWRETVNDGIVRYQEGGTVQPGDIILMHFRPRFVDDFIAALQAISSAGLTPALLEDYLPEP